MKVWLTVRRQALLLYTIPKKTHQTQPREFSNSAFYTPGRIRARPSRWCSMTRRACCRMITNPHVAITVKSPPREVHPFGLQACPVEAWPLHALTKFVTSSECCVTRVFSSVR